MKFSQRIGMKPIKTEIQIDSMDIDLRTALWNSFHLYYLQRIHSSWISQSKFKWFFASLWHNYFKFPIDTLNDSEAETTKIIRDWFFKFEWFEVYDFIEFISCQDCPVDADEFRKFCNNMLERELSAYRFVGEVITKITDENELNEIEEAINSSMKTKLSGVHLHLKSALAKLSDRKDPDYRNSIKESISAVESISQIISGNSKAGLGQALKILEQNVGLHNALKKGFMAIYGYTSDEGGIRHAMLEEKIIDFEDAKFMLVSCSAFINYLIMKSTKSGIEF